MKVKIYLKQPIGQVVSFICSSAQYEAIKKGVDMGKGSLCVMSGRGDETTIPVENIAYVVGEPG